MINIIADILAGKYTKSYKEAQKNKFLNKMRNHENLQKLNKNKRDDLIEDCLDLINKLEEDYYDYGDDPSIEILVAPDGERYKFFRAVIDRWEDYEYYKMCHWQYLYSFSISEIYELD